MKLNTFWGLKGLAKRVHVKLEMLGHGLVERLDKCAWNFQTDEDIKQIPQAKDFFAPVKSNLNRPNNVPDATRVNHVGIN